MGIRVKSFLLIFAAFLSSVHAMDICSSMLGGVEFGSVSHGLDLITEEYFEILLTQPKVNKFIEQYRTIRASIKNQEDIAYDLMTLANLLNIVESHVFFGESQHLYALFDNFDMQLHLRFFAKKIFDFVDDQEARNALVVLMRRHFLFRINGDFILFEGLVEILKRYKNNASNGELIARLQLLTFHNSNAYDALVSELNKLDEDSNYMNNSIMPKITALFHNNSNLNSLCSSFGENPLHIFATINQKNLIQDFLEIQPDVDLNQQTFTGLTPLMCATRTLNLEAVNALAKADCTIKDKDGKTAYAWLTAQIAENRFQGECLELALLIKRKLENMYTYYQWYISRDL